MDDPIGKALQRNIDRKILGEFYKTHGYDENGKRPEELERLEKDLDENTVDNLSNYFSSRPSRSGLMGPE